MKRLAIFLGLIIVILLGNSFGSVRAESSHMRMFSTEGEFEDIKFFVRDAVISQGLTVDYQGHIGEMLARTRADVGSTKVIYKNAEFILFCSAVISRATMEADPANISFCPYIVFYYELETEPGKVYVGYRRPAIVGTKASKKSLAAVDKLLERIVREATE